MDKLTILFYEPHHLGDDLDFSPISNLGELIMGESSLSPNKPLEINYLIAGNRIIDKEVLDKFPHLRAIVKAGTGVDQINLREARARGVDVINFPGYASEAVAQTTLMFMLALAGSLLPYNDLVRKYEWEKRFLTHPLILLRGKTLGIIGLGKISRRVIELAKAFFMEIILYTRYQDESLPISYVSLSELARRSDFVSVHSQLDNETRSLINVDFLSLVKKECFIINTARAAIINEEAIISALKEKRIGGLALDVFFTEPLKNDHPLLHFDNVLITPHNAWGQREVRECLVNSIASCIKSHSQNDLQSINTVNRF
jgi:glycerate dehydrogenase